MQVIPWSAMKILMQRAMNRARGIITIKISVVYLRLHAQHWSLSLKFQQAFSFWSWCLCSLTEGEGAHIRYLLCASSDSVSETVTHTLSLMNIAQKIPECKAVSCVFPPWHLAENCQRVFAALLWNAWIVPGSGALPKHVFIVSSQKLLLNLRLLIWEQWFFPSSLQSSCYLGNYSLNQNQVKSTLRFLFCLNLGSYPNRFLLFLS